MRPPVGKMDSLASGLRSSFARVGQTVGWSCSASGCRCLVSWRPKVRRGSRDEPCGWRKFVAVRKLFVSDVLDRVCSRPMANVGRNVACPCGSGRKYKKCCIGQRTTVAAYTSADKDAALRRLLHTIHPEDLEAALERFLDGHRQLGQTPKHPTVEHMTEYAFLWWAFFDELVEDETIADHVLANTRDLGPGERNFLEMARLTSMRLYEIVAVQPGSSMTVRDVLHGHDIQVAERSASRQLHAGDLIAARVMPQGASGQPELDGGLFPIQASLRQSLVDDLEFMQDDLDDAERKEFLPPMFFRAWMTPTFPKLANFDGEPIVMTKVVFDVINEAKLVNALHSTSELEQSNEVTIWDWVKKSRKNPVSLGHLEIREGRLELEVNSRERGERGKTMIEKLGKGAVKHRVTEYRNMEQALASARDKPREPKPLPKELAEPARQAVLQYLQQHYERWVDEPVPMLDGETPRYAATKPELRGRVAKLIEGLEEMYEKAREEGSAAYDPGWMWKELGLEDLARERSRSMR